MGKKSKARQKETPMEREAALIAAENWNRYQSVFVPIENEFIRQVQLGPQDYQRAQEAAVGANRMQFGQARQDATRQLFAGGVNPNSGRFQGALADLARGQAASAAQGVVGANVDTRRRNLAGLEAAVSLGRGQKTQADLGISSIAARQAQKASADAQRQFQSRLATQTAIGQAAGLGLGYLKNKNTFDKNPITDSGIF